MALEDDLRTLRGRIGQAKTKQVRAQADYEGAHSRVETARKDLQDTFGVSTLDDARTKLAELTEDLQQKKSDVEKKLQEAGA